MSDVNSTGSGRLGGPAALAHPRRDRPRAAHGGPRRHGDEHRAAVRAARAALQHGGPAVGGHGLHPGVRQPAPARREAGRPARPEGDVPDRTGRLRGRLGHRRCLGQLRHAGDRARLPGRVRRDPGAVGAVAADDHVHRAEGSRQGVRRLRRDRRGRRRRGPAARRRADRVPVLALDAVRQPDLRGPRVRRRSAPAQAAAVAGQAQAGHPRRAAGVRGLFCLVYGFSNAATHNWHTPSTWGFLVAGVVLLVVFALWQTRAANPLLPPRVVLDRNRGGAYASMLIASGRDVRRRSCS